MLVSSLPPLPVRFEVPRLPITIERLQGRLRMLEPAEIAYLHLHNAKPGCFAARVDRA